MDELPESNGGWMKDPVALLRRERDRSRPRRRRTAAACATLALIVAPAAVAGSLRPDPPAGSLPTGLQPDAFGGTAASTAVAPVRDTEAVSPLGKAVATAPVQKPVAPKVTTTPVTTPAPRVVHLTPVVTRPPAPAPVAAPVTRTVTRPVTKPRVVIPAHVSGAATLRPRLPLHVHGSARVPATDRALATPVTAAVHRRDLLPAALALLALVATSGCLLAVAARLRREGAGA
jgi:hypothetical protein